MPRLTGHQGHEKWKKTGITPNDTNAKQLKFDMPALKDHIERIRLLDIDLNYFRQDKEIAQYRKDVAAGNFILPSLRKQSEMLIADYNKGVC